MSVKHRCSARVTIFEGPDGSGKTTLARAFAEVTGARYVHCGPLPSLTRGLARIYAEAMLPAALGYQDVVLDRCWLSERPYGETFRGGVDRLGRASVRMLERLALRCGAVVVRCLPPYEHVLRSYRARRAKEMLETEPQLRQVYEAYARLTTDLPMFMWDFTVAGNHMLSDVVAQVEALRAPAHPLDVVSAGSWRAPAVLVGEAFGEVKEHDTLYQWPFASFSAEGCSRWLTEQLELEGAPESQLLWVNADQRLDWLLETEHKQVVALGRAAEAALYRLKIAGHTAPHPQSWKRFNHGRRYPLLDLLRRS